MKIHELMTRDIATCTPHDTLAKAVQVMWDRDIGFLPVTDPQTQELRGVLTDRDACMAACMRHQRFDQIPVHSAMCERVHTCAADDEVHNVHARMREHQIRRMPVIDDKNHVTGAISLNDLALHAQKHIDEQKDVATTLGAISMHRGLEATAAATPLTSTHSTTPAKTGPAPTAAAPKTTPEKPRARDTKATKDPKRR